MTGDWIAGFVAGEGCFAFHYDGSRYRACFTLKLRDDDLPILERIRRFFGFGSVTRQGDDGTSRPSAVFRVWSLGDCLSLVDFFRRHDILAKKRNDFDVWARFVEWRASSPYQMTIAENFVRSLRRQRDYRAPEDGTGYVLDDRVSHGGWSQGLFPWASVG